VFFIQPESGCWRADKSSNYKGSSLFELI
jgi:hypothetical protein